MTNARFPILSAGALLAAGTSPRPDVLAPLLVADSAALVYGPPGIGKSFFALGVAWAVAEGGSFLGWQAPRPQRVIHVDGGLGAPALRERLALFGPPPDGLKVCPLDLAAGPLPDLSTWSELVRFMEAWESNFDLVVLDLASGHGNTESWTGLQRFLQHQRRRRRAVLVVQQVNKEGTLHGSLRRAHDVDVVIALQRAGRGAPTGNARFTVHIEKAQRRTAAMVAPLLAELESDPSSHRAHWSWGPAEDLAVRDVARLLKQGLKPREAIAALGLSHTKFYLLRTEAQQKGLLPCPPRKKTHQSP